MHLKYLRSVKVYNFKMFLEIQHYAILFRLGVGAGEGLTCVSEIELYFVAQWIFNCSNYEEKLKLVGLTLKHKTILQVFWKLWSKN